MSSLLSKVISLVPTYLAGGQLIVFKSLPIVFDEQFALETGPMMSRVFCAEDSEFESSYREYPLKTFWLFKIENGKQSSKNSN